MNNVIRACERSGKRSWLKVGMERSVSGSQKGGRVERNIAERIRSGKRLVRYTNALIKGWSSRFRSPKSAAPTFN